MHADPIPYGFCQCGCGRRTSIVTMTNKARGYVKGEPFRFVAGHRAPRHGYSATPTWNSWRSMNSRCLDPNATGWKHYGGRGITICDRWRGPDGFPNFLADMGERPEGRTLDRIDNDGNYEPENCRWATGHEQSANGRKTHCKNGHEYTPENTHVTAKGYRICRACGCAKTKRRRMRKRAARLAGMTHLPNPRPVDRCAICGQFVGWYPVGFCCDRHCSKCVCSTCPPAIIEAARFWGDRVAA